MSTSQIALLASVQQFLDRQHGLYIDGAPCAAQSENRLTVWDPATGQAIATTADASPADVDRAVMSAWRAFVDRRWAGRTPADRERILLRFADLVEQHGEELAQLETLEQGKSIAISRAFEVGCTLNWMRYTAGLTTKISGRTLDVSIPFPQGARYQAWTKKEPVGVVAGIVVEFPADDRHVEGHAGPGGGLFDRHQTLGNHPADPAAGGGAGDPGGHS